MPEASNLDRFRFRGGGHYHRSRYRHWAFDGLGLEDITMARRPYFSFEHHGDSQNADEPRLDVHSFQ